MNLFPEQISAAGSRQLEAQFQLLRSATGSAFDSAEKLMALHFDTTRSTLEKTTSLMRQLSAAKDPRDFFALASDTQSQVESVLAYQRKLVNIASSMTSSIAGLRPSVTPVANAALEKLAALPPVAEQAVEVVEVVIDAPVAEPAPAPVEDAEPIAELTPVAEAVGHQEPHPAAAPLTVTDSATPIQVEMAAAPAGKAAGRPKKK
ncbi:MAG: phasin family protein [Massilia sp.]